MEDVGVTMARAKGKSRIRTDKSSTPATLTFPGENIKYKSKRIRRVHVLRKPTPSPRVLERPSRTLAIESSHFDISPLTRDGLRSYLPLNHDENGARNYAARASESFKFLVCFS